MSLGLPLSGGFSACRTTIRVAGPEGLVAGAPAAAPAEWPATVLLDAAPAPEAQPATAVAPATTPPAPSMRSSRRREVRSNTRISVTTNHTNLV
jgi:hypothetical protein